MRNGPAVEGRGRNWNKTKFEHLSYTISTFPGQCCCRTVTFGEAAELVLLRILVRRLRCAT